MNAKKASKKVSKKQTGIPDHAAVIDSPTAAGKPEGKDGPADPQFAGTSNRSTSADQNNPPKESQKKKKAGTNSRERPPDRKDVIQLATQLVSAQIVAQSHHETAMNLFKEFRRLTLDVADLLRPNTTTTISRPATNLAPDEVNVDVANQDEVPDLNSTLSPVIELIREKNLSRLLARKPPVLQPMSHPDLDRLFQSALRRAFVMLNAPFDSERIVFAEQIFGPKESLREGTIRKRFIDVQWPNLSSGESVTKLMRDVKRWFSTHQEDLRAAHQSVNGQESISATDPDIPIATRIEAEAARLSWLLRRASESGSLATDTEASYRALESALSKFHSIRDGYDIGGAFRMHNAIERENLINFMLGGIVPRAVDSKEAPSPRYRPRAIFHYLRLHGQESEDELGRNLNERLRVKRSEINPDLVPDIPGIERVGFGFGPLHQELDDLLQELVENGGYSDCAANSDELKPHGVDTYGIESDDFGYGSHDSQADESPPIF